MVFAAGKRTLSLFLSVLLLLGLLPGISLTKASETPLATLFFASDYQYEAGFSPAQPSATLTSILGSVTAAGKTVNTAVFCGDYTNSGGYNYDASAVSAISEIEGIVDTNLGTSVDTVYLQGNHDLYDSSLMAPTGAVEYDDYIVYVINTQGSNPWMQGATGSAAIMRATANALQTYLNGLIAANDTRPVFIATHVPLHMTSRTSSRYSTNNGDNMYSSYLFDVINEAAQQLDIVFFYGHNHSHGWDSYLGGSTAYLPVGATIYIPDINGVSTAYTNQYTAETLNFTYMNAGFLGYNSYSSADDTLTGTVIELYGDSIVLNRYSADGVHRVGSAGAYNTNSDSTSYDDSTGFPNGSTAYTPTAGNTASPVSINRKQTASTEPLLRLSGYQAQTTLAQTDTVTASLYNATATGYRWTSSDSAVAKISGSGRSAVVEYNKVGQASVTCIATYNIDGTPTEISASYNVTVTAQTVGSGTRTYSLVTDVSTITDGQYLLFYSNKNIVEPEIITYSSRTGLVTDTAVSQAGNTVIESGDYAALEWTFKKNGSAWCLSHTESGSTQYLVLSTSSSYPASWVTSETSATNFSLAQNGNYVNLTYNDNGSNKVQYSTTRYLTYGYDSSANTTDFYLYRYTGEISGAPSAQITDTAGTAPMSEYPVGGTLALRAKLSNITEVVSYEWNTSDSGVIALTGKNTASPTVRFAGTGEATITLTVTYVENGVQKTVSAAAGPITVANARQYERLSSVSDLVSGKQYLIIWGDVGASGELVSHTAASTSSAAGLAPAATDTVLSDTILGDYSSYEWTFTLENENWYIGVPESTSQYINIASNSVTLGAASALSVTHNGNKFTITSNNTSCSLDRFSATLFSGYNGGTNRYCQIYRLIEETADPYADILLGTRVITDVLQRRYTVTALQEEQLMPDYGGITSPGVTWTSFNEAVASISDDGLLTFTGARGYTYITMTVTGTNETGTPVTFTKGVTYFADPNPQTSGTDDYPSYPDAGSVRLDKTAYSVDFQTTGVAQIELTFDGMPGNKSNDIVIVLDMSSSMKDQVYGAARVEVMRQSLLTLVNDLLGPNKDGTPSENRVAIVAFNNYDYTEISVDNNVNYTTTENTAGFNFTATGQNPIWTGGQTLASAFSGADEIEAVVSKVNTYCTETYCKSGTNYDLGLMEAYKILENAKSEANYDSRQAVVFMSDGAPYQYNYFRGYSGNGDAGKGIQWNAWLSGDETNETIASLLSGTSTDAADYFEPNGLNYWAEAIKSQTNGNKVIDPYAGLESDRYIRSVDGLGADLYTIGFCLSMDGEITEENEKAVLEEVASSSEKAYYANSSTELDTAFEEISTSILLAAKDTVVTDVIGAEFDLQYASSRSANGTTIDLTDSAYIGNAPYIEFGTYALTDAGKPVSGSYTALETITFTTDSLGNLTGAYSNVLSGNLYDGTLIRGKYVTLDTDSETFTWNIGDVAANTQYSLRYFAYLTGALEGTREPGSYKTNEYALANYTNYREAACTAYYPVPRVPWQAATVSYEYYLVNEQGQPINEDGAVVSFENRVTYYTDAETIYLNASGGFDAFTLQAAASLPEGYMLYENTAAYYIHVGSGSNESAAYIRDENAVQTTFLSYPKNVLYTASSGSVGTMAYNYTLENLYDYTNTHVAFAVTAVPEQTQRSVLKVWSDSENAWQARPKSVSVQLYADNEAYGDPVVLSTANGWKYTWENLTKYRYEQGTATQEEVMYTLTETAVPNYTANITYAEETTLFTVTNTYQNGYTLELLKNNDSGETLSGAQFGLYLNEACTQPAAVYLDAAKETPFTASSQAVTGTNGLLSFYGLSAGTYYLKEMSVPAGYSILASPFVLVLSEDGSTASVTTPNGTYPVTVSNGVLHLTITNHLLNIDIPYTAGFGAYGFFAAGLLFMAGTLAAVVRIKYKKRRCVKH